MINWMRSMVACLAWVIPGGKDVGNRFAGLTEEEEQMCQDYINNKWENKNA